MYAIMTSKAYIIMHVIYPGPMGGSSTVVLSTGVSVAITAVLCSVVFFALGVLSTLLVVYCLSSTAKRRAQYSVSSSSTEPQTPAPVYEEVTKPEILPRVIDLNENIAYGPVIELNVNAAYLPARP